MNDKIYEKLKKVRNLANQGSAGEREAAKHLLNELLTKYDISEESLDDTEPYDFWISWDDVEYHRQLLLQTALKICGIKLMCRKVESKYCFLVTKTQAIEIEFNFELYKRSLDKELEATYTAFIYRNNIFPPDGEPKDISEVPEDVLEAYNKAMERMSLIEKVSLSKELEHKG